MLRDTSAHTLTLIYIKYKDTYISLYMCTPSEMTKALNANSESNYHNHPGNNVRLTLHTYRRTTRARTDRRLM